jgi:outer membrane protein OmpA-like peptidoglycan-associated protein
MANRAPRKEPSHEGGNFWTSYSDLLLGLSVIFLVLFFFSTLRAGVEQLKAKITVEDSQNFLKGKVPESLAKEQQSQREQLKKNLDELNQQRVQMAQSALQANQAMKNLETQQQLFDSMMKQQAEQAAALRAVSEANEKLEHSKKETSQELEDAKKAQLRLQALVQTNDQNLAKLQGDLSAKQKQIEEAQTALKEKNQTLAQFDQEKAAHARTREDFERLRQESQETLKATLEKERQAKLSVETRLSRLQAQAAGDQEQLSGIRKKLVETEQALNQAKTESARLIASNQAMKGRQQGFEKKLGAAEGEAEGWRKKAQALQGRLGALENQNQAQGRKLASLDGELRQAIAKNLVKGFEGSGVAATVNPTSGTLIVSMDALQFLNGSAELSETAKRQLRNLIPTYAKSLFGETSHAGRISEIRVSGHASPRFGFNYVDPKAADKTAKEYNLDLSRRRSQAIADFLFGSEIGTYPHKAEMRIYTRSEGFGHTYPVRAPAGIPAGEPCGPYDCAKSRRVEISFQLKDEKR